jgi:hyperosmotically inducible protein
LKRSWNGFAGLQISESAAENSDAWVTMKVKAALLFHRNVSAMTEVDTKDKIVTLVETNKGLVTLDGTARNAAEKDLVTKYVQDVYNVKSVLNNMTIKEPKSKTTRISAPILVRD